MNYFMSNLHGASEAYFEMKERINFKNNDELFILGDVFDGNSSNPEASLHIISDIMQSNNIHLILGDHEYAHIMHMSAEENPETKDEWEQYLIASDFGGASLLKYMKNNLTQRERDTYLSFLISCNMSEMVKIGKRYFYLVHGAPVICKQGDIFTWQKEVVFNELELQKNYSMAIMQDPCINCPADIKNNLFIISGHSPTKKYFDKYGGLLKKYYGESNGVKQQKVILEDSKFLINCGASADTLGAIENDWKNDLACLAIDAAGFFIEYLLT